MPVLDINGRSVTVDDSFLKLSPDQQNATVEEIAASLPQQKSMLSDIGSEIGKSVSGNLETIQNAGGHGEKTVGQGWLDTGKAVLAVPGLLSAPITGAIRAIGGTGMKGATDAATSGLQSAFGGAREEMPIEAARDQAETASMAIKPANMGARGLLPVPQKQLPAPSGAELRAAAQAGYKAPEVAAVEISPQSTGNLASKIENDLLTQGFRPKPNQGGPVFDEIRGMTPGAGVSSVRVDDISSIRRALAQVAREKDAIGQATPNAAAASRAIEEISSFLPNISKADVIAGDPAKASAIMKVADANYRGYKQSKLLDTQLSRAERQAARSGAGSNIENAMRQKVSQVLDNPRRASQLAPDIREAAEKFVRGTKTRNALRYIGKAGVDGGLSLLLHAGAAIPSGGATIPVAAGGTAARKIGEILTAKQGRALSEMARAKTPLAQSRAIAPLIKKPGTLRAIIAAMLANGQGAAMPRMLLPAYGEENQ